MPRLLPPSPSHPHLSLRRRAGLIRGKQTCKRRSLLVHLFLRNLSDFIIFIHLLVHAMTWHRVLLNLLFVVTYIYDRLAVHLGVSNVDR